MSHIIPYGHMVQDYYVRQVRSVAAERRMRRAKIHTATAAAHLVHDVRAKVARCFGSFPSRTPLAPIVTGIVQRPRYRIENVIFHSRPNFPVTANLYLPQQVKGPCPGVIGTCGHSLLGKAAAAYQSFCQSLAQQGFVVLIYDPISQGERKQYVAERHPLAPTSLCAEHNMLGNRMQLMGDWFGTWCAWDGIRALDYLLTRPEVDPTRIGVTGNSGGGTLAAYLNALDDRFTMAAPSCFVTTYVRNIENELPQDSEQIPPGFLAAGLDMADFFIAQAPRPTLLLGQRNDFFDSRGLEETYEEVRRVYALLGAENRVALYIGPDEHGYHRKNREAMYAFFARHAGLRARRNESRIKVEAEATLQCTHQGQVVTERPGCRTVFDFTRMEAEALARRTPLTLAQVCEAARAALNLDMPDRSPAYRRIGHIRENSKDHPLHISRFAVETEADIQALLFFIPPKGAAIRHHLEGATTTTLYLPHLASRADIENHELDFMTETGGGFALDPRGVGESLPLTCFFGDFFNSYDSDFLCACVGSLLGTPYLSGKVFDVLGTLRLLHEHGYKKIHLVGRGLGAITGAFAALLSK